MDHKYIKDKRIVKIFAFSPISNPLNPQECNGTKQKIGSGVFIESNLILTNSKLIEKTYQPHGIKISLPFENTFYSVRIVMLVPELDIALLSLGSKEYNDIFLSTNHNKSTTNEIPSPFFKTYQHQWLTFDQIPIKSDISIVGYNTDSTQSTLINTIYGGIKKDVISIEKFLEPGMSGSPVLYQDKVIGIVSTYFDHDLLDIKYHIVPIYFYYILKPLIPILDQTLDLISEPIKSPVIRISSLGINITNNIFSSHGALINYVSKHSVLYSFINPQDIIQNITVYNKTHNINQSIEVDNQGNIKGKNISIHYLVKCLPIDTQFRFDYFSSIDQQQKSTPLLTLNSDSCVGGIKIYEPFEKLEYYEIKGMILMSLNVFHFIKYPILKHKLSLSEQENPQVIISLVKNDSPLKKWFHGGEIITHINYQPINSLSQCKLEFESLQNKKQDKDHFIILKSSDQPEIKIKW